MNNSADESNYIHCPSCNKRIEAGAIGCIDCGTIVTNRPRNLAIIGVLAIIVMGLIFSQNKMTSDKKQVLPKKASSSQEKAPAKASTSLVCNKFELLYDLNGENLTLSIKADLPDDTNIIITLRRSYWEKGNDVIPSFHNYFIEKSDLTKWKEPQAITISHQTWAKELLLLNELAESTAVERVDDQLEILAIVHPNQNHPKFGEENKYLKGKMVNKTGPRVVICKQELACPLGDGGMKSVLDTIVREDMQKKAKKEAQLVALKKEAEEYSKSARSYQQAIALNNRLLKKGEYITYVTKTGTITRKWFSGRQAARFDWEGNSKRMPAKSKANVDYFIKLTREADQYNLTLAKVKDHFNYLNNQITELSAPSAKDEQDLQEKYVELMPRLVLKKDVLKIQENIKAAKLRATESRQPSAGLTRMDMLESYHNQERFRGYSDPDELLRDMKVLEAGGSKGAAQVVRELEPVKRGGETSTRIARKFEPRESSTGLSRRDMINNYHNQGRFRGYNDPEELLRDMKVLQAGGSKGAAQVVRELEQEK